MADVLPPAPPAGAFAGQPMDDVDAASLEELRGLVADVFPDEQVYPGAGDETLRRFLRARGDVAGAEAQLRRTMIWRAEQGVAQLYQRERDVNEPIYQRLTPFSYHQRKHALDGSPMYIAREGLVDINQLLHALTEEEISVRHIHHMEHMERMALDNAEALGGPVERGLNIMDLRHLKLSPNSRGMKVFRNTVHIDTEYYPERLGHLFIINSPGIFRVLWSVIKTWIDERTRNKFDILGSNVAEVLGRYIAPENLPAEYGGTCECEGGCIPQLGADGLAGLFEALPVRPKQRAERQVRVEAGQLLRWRFFTEKKEVGFRLTWTPDGDGDGDEAEPQVIAEADSLPAHERPFFGEVRGEPAGGVATLQFDNSRSRLTSKTVRLWCVTEDLPAAPPAPPTPCSSVNSSEPYDLWRTA